MNKNPKYPEVNQKARVYGLIAMKNITDDFKKTPFDYVSIQELIQSLPDISCEIENFFSEYLIRRATEETLLDRISLSKVSQIVEDLFQAPIFQEWYKISKVDYNDLLKKPQARVQEER